MASCTLMTDFMDAVRQELHSVAGNVAPISRARRHSRASIIVCYVWERTLYFRGVLRMEIEQLGQLDIPPCAEGTMVRARALPPCLNGAASVRGAQRHNVWSQGPICSILLVPTGRRV